MKPYCQDHQQVFCLETPVIESRPGAILLDRSPFFPGGGGQLADRGKVVSSIGEFDVVGITRETRGYWHELSGSAEIRDLVQVSIDSGFRQLMSELHTVAHVVNALVFMKFGGALLTGAQLNANETLRLDFDIPGVESEKLRALEEPINDALKEDFRVSTSYIFRSDAESVPGIFRSKSVTPPVQDDGMVRLVNIAELDRQACGGTHLVSTGCARRAKILKIDNKGRHNRRVVLSMIG